MNITKPLGIAIEESPDRSGGLFLNRPISSHIIFNAPYAGWQHTKLTLLS